MRAIILERDEQYLLNHCTKYLYRPNVTVGVRNYIDKLLAREERYQRPAQRTCLGMIRAVLRLRFPNKAPEYLNRSPYAALYGDMAARGNGNSLFADGWQVSLPSGRSVPWPDQLP